MKRQGYAVVALLVVFLGQFAAVNCIPGWNAFEGAFGDSVTHTSPDRGNDQDKVAPAEPAPDDEGIDSPMQGFLTAQDMGSGTLNPVSVEQRGYTTSGNLSARTDTGTNTSANLFIDQEHGWKGSLAEVNVSGLQRLYVVNGSFLTGTPGSNANPNGTVACKPDGWNAMSNSTNTFQTQVATYDQSGTRFVAVENRGKQAGINYYHYAGTRVLWTQSVDNVPQTT